jgi:hypothetical protein
MKEPHQSAQHLRPHSTPAVLRLIFEQITVDDDRIVSVTPRDAFVPNFQFGAKSGGKARERRDSNPRPPACKAGAVTRRHPTPLDRLHLLDLIRLQRTRMEMSARTVLARPLPR